ncbi:DUF4350 domain-containing protein [Bacteroides sp. 214]|uniref:DUF4350 domain-containing protein n=1 Tax=Bacteroides sp. 214 TaxID=2302935 RepID=UPI0013CFBBEE|nr:DUF4350 domain-containing protein [Bacteroides sp. 214]NDW12286.1 DUF4350 domain-containing protein [Bacteroides sp. 214]
MKGSHIYIVCILTFFVIMFVVEYNTPKKFVWRATFSQYDKQPLGSAIFDDVARASLPNGYEVSKRTIYQIAKDSLEKKNYLIVTDRLTLSNEDVNTLLELAAEGQSFMLVASSFPQSMKDTMDFYVDWGTGNHSLTSLKRYAMQDASRDTLYWYADSLYEGRSFTAFPHLTPNYFAIGDTSRLDPLVIKFHYNKEKEEEEDDELEEDSTYTYWIPFTAATYPVGKGEVCLVSTPLLFTNYGMLDGDNADYLFRLLSRLADLPVERTEAYFDNPYEDQSPFRYFLSQRPLRWGLYGALLLVLLFMIFTARRKQRVIPIMSKPGNPSVAFTELIASLYYQRKDHVGLLRKKYLYFAETLRRAVQIDIDDGSDARTLAHKLAQKTGMEALRLERTLIAIQSVLQENRSITEEQLKKYIDKINEIINRI